MISRIRSRVKRWVRSLEFQLYMVMLSLCLGAILFLGNVYLENRALAERVRDLVASAEISSMLADWATEITITAKERTKYFAVDDNIYLESMEASRVKAKSIYQKILHKGLPSSLGSTNSIVQLKIQKQNLDDLVDSACVIKNNNEQDVFSENIKNVEGEFKSAITSTLNLMQEERQNHLTILQDALHRGKIHLIITLLSLVILILLFWLTLQRKILEPLRLLEVGTARIADGNLGITVDIHSTHEMEKLAEGFNEMSRRLKSKQNAEVNTKQLEAISQVARSVNHEINNPLMVISANAEYLLAVLDRLDPSHQQKLNSILDEVTRIHTVTQQLREIRQPVTANYTNESDQMIDIARSSQILDRRMFNGFR